MSRIIDKYTFISTKNGDAGTSRNYSNGTLPKTDLLFEALGTIDELSSMLGLTYHYSAYQKELTTIQLDLQHIMSLIATRTDDPRYGTLSAITDSDITRLELYEQTILTTCQIEPRFVLPGSESSKEGAYLDVSRSLARKCERTILRYKAFHHRDDLNLVAMYLNRLSDLLFIMARSKDKIK